jgi:hypothetical protein
MRLRVGAVGGTASGMGVGLMEVFRGLIDTRRAGLASEYANPREKSTG